MSLKFRISNLSELGENASEELKGLYAKETLDGKEVYTLQVDDVKPMAEFNKVYDTLKKEREAKDVAEKTLKAFGDWTPEKIQQTVTEYETLKIAKTTNGEDEFLKKMDEIRMNNQKNIEDMRVNWAQQEATYKQEIERGKKDLQDMKLANEITTLYSKKGDPSGLPLAIEQAKKELVWNNESGYFTTRDGFKKANNWMDEDLFKEFPCLLKGSASGGARGGETSGVNYEKWFNPKSADYSEDPNSVAYAKRLECYRQNPDLANQYITKYSK